MNPLMIFGLLLIVLALVLPGCLVTGSSIPVNLAIETMQRASDMGALPNRSRPDQ